VVTRALLSILLLAGCKDERQRVATEIFTCDPNSHTADYDCGDNFVCYTATQAVGRSVCVKACDPDDPRKACPNGACTHGGECLAYCDADKLENPCGTGDVLSCVRTTYDPFENDDKDGVCLPIAFSCKESNECNSPVFNLCTSETNGQQWSSALATTGSICAQGNCERDGVACEPGSTCIRKLIPNAGNEIPDVCAPNCQTRKLPNGDAVDQCIVGFTCLSEAFPQTETRVCAPGTAGWICNDPLGCVVGSCLPWSEDGSLHELKTCSPKCEKDSDCWLYDQEGNPGPYTHFSCQKGRCQNLQAMLFSDFCVRDGAPCSLDPEATTCRVRTAAPAPAPDPDGGMPAGTFCPQLPPIALPLSQLAGFPGICIRNCVSDSDCATLSDKTHVTHSCVGGECSLSLPYLVACTADTGCLPGTHCLDPVEARPYKVCTIECTTDQDCADVRVLGSNYLCHKNRCVPKSSSGCPPVVEADSGCLSARHSNGLCVSPKGWLCDNDGQCLSGHCSNSGSGSDDIKHCE
jgi:hypothetical protein